jgi:ferredoxin
MRVRLMPLGAIAELAPGERLLDALDERGLPVLATACRAANCGICVVVVRGDSAGLAPPEAEEQRLLASLGGAAGRRLGCQIHASSDATDEEVVLDILAARRP